MHKNFRKDYSKIFLVQEQNERALPGIPADPGGHAGVLHHHAHGGHLEAHHPVVRRQPHLQGTYPQNSRSVAQFIDPVRE